MAFNKVILMGRLTSDPESKQTQSGTAVTSFTLAVDRRYNSGEEKKCAGLPSMSLSCNSPEDGLEVLTSTKIPLSCSSQTFKSGLMPSEPK